MCIASTPDAPKREPIAPPPAPPPPVPIAERVESAKPQSKTRQQARLGTGQLRVKRASNVNIPG